MPVPCTMEILDSSALKTTTYYLDIGIPFLVTASGHCS